MNTQLSFSVGSMVSRNLSFVFKYILQYFPVALLLFVGPVALFSVLLWTDPNLGENSDALDVFNSGLMPYIGGVLLILFLLGIVFTAFLIHHSAAVIAGHDASVKTSLIKAFSAFFPLFAFYIVFYVTMLLGFLLFIIPGIFIALAWSAGPGAIVHEGAGPFAAIKRSMELTKGYRFPLLGFFILIMLISMAISAVFSVAQFAIGTPAATLSGEWSALVLVGILILDIPSQYITLTLYPLASAVLYMELRRVKENYGGETLAQTFD